MEDAAAEGATEKKFVVLVQTMVGVEVGEGTMEYAVARGATVMKILISRLIKDLLIDVAKKLLAIAHGLDHPGQWVSSVALRYRDGVMSVNQ
jgi:hypothetical protein